MWATMIHFHLIATAAVLLSAVNGEPFKEENGFSLSSLDPMQIKYLESDVTLKEKEAEASVFRGKTTHSLEETTTSLEDSSVTLEKERENALLIPLMNKIARLSQETKMEMANTIVVSAERSLELIDSFKEGFVQELHGMDWQRAHQKYYPGSFSASYLPVPPQSLCEPCHIDVELTRSYALMQHCAVSLEVLNLDQVLKDTTYSYFGDVNKVTSHVIESLNHLKTYMNEEQCSPDSHETNAMTAQIYEEASRKTRGIRDFVILRDVRASFQNMRDTFKRIQGQ